MSKTSHLQIGAHGLIDDAVVEQSHILKKKKLKYPYMIDKFLDGHSRESGSDTKIST